MNGPTLAAFCTREISIAIDYLLGVLMHIIWLLGHSDVITKYHIQYKSSRQSNVKVYQP